MRRGLSTIALAAALLTLLPRSQALAGQIRINISGNSFVPVAGTTLNVNDHAVWVMTNAGTHTVTSGSSCTSNGRFNSGNISFAASGTAFSWKSDAVGAVPYFCTPHCSIGMTGSLSVVASGTAVADFRITEVKYDAAGGLDLIEITNLGDAAGDLGRYRIAASNDSATVPANSWTVPAGGRVIVHVNTSAPQDIPSNMYLPSLADLPTSGSLGLYVPNTVGGTANGLLSSTQIIDFVQWGAGGNLYETQAVQAGLWFSGEFLPTMAPSHSIEFCGGRANNGLQYWSEIASPNFGSNGGCTTQALKTTWGRVKALYR